MRIDGQNLTLIYDTETDSETHALRDVSVSFEKNGITGIMGPSGSGKSSLLYVLAGLKKPTSGTVYYNDMDMEAYSSDQREQIRKERFGFIFQKHFLIDYLSILDNVLVPVNKKNRESCDYALSLLDRLGLGKLAGKLPRALSCGQRQRAAVARALVNRPEVIFADEPTASLDHGNALEVMQVLGEFRETAVLLVVTHDRSILGDADQVLDMWDGRMHS